MSPLGSTETPPYSPYKSPALVDALSDPPTIVLDEYVAQVALGFVSSTPFIEVFEDPSASTRNRGTGKHVG
jgi:hypothetical protein